MQAPAGVFTRTTDGLVTGRILLGFSVDASTAAEVQIRHGSATGDIVATARLGAAGVAGPHWLGPNGISCPDGVWVEVVAGTVTVSVYTA